MLVVEHPCVSLVPNHQGSEKGEEDHCLAVRRSSFGHERPPFFHCEHRPKVWIELGETKSILQETPHSLIAVSQ